MTHTIAAPYVTSADFRAALLDAGLLVSTSADGLYHRSGTFEDIVRGIEVLASAAGSELGPARPRYYFPPIMPRESFIHTDYLRSFPDLVGSVDIFAGGDREHAELLRLLDEGADWTQTLQPAEVMLCSSACHPLYGTLGQTAPAEGWNVECQGWVFRHEPSLDPARMQSFRQHEFVYVGSEDGAVEHRDVWLARGLQLLGSLGLDVRPDIANDPFFGRAGRMLVANQRQTELKYEILADITAEKPTAIASANCHLEHFGAPFGIRSADGNVAHSACIGFGLERITLALLATHGLDVAEWPADIAGQLRLR